MAPGPALNVIQMLSSASIDSSVTNVDDDIQRQQISLSEKVLTTTFLPFCLTLNPTDPPFRTHKNLVKGKKKRQPFHTHME